MFIHEWWSGEDFCARGHDCDTNAKCKNLKTGKLCECNKGFWGDGSRGQCTDIDECRKRSGQDAHSCQSNSKCINTPGSYRCECDSGFIHLNSTLCIGMCKTFPKCSFHLTAFMIEIFNFRFPSFHFPVVRCGWMWNWSAWMQRRLNMHQHSWILQVSKQRDRK